MFTLFTCVRIKAHMQNLAQYKRRRIYDNVLFTLVKKDILYK